MTATCWLTVTGNIVPTLAKSSSWLADWAWLIFGAAILLAGYGLVRWNSLRLQAGGESNSSKGLLAELATAHNLSRPERILLTEAAAARQLSDPAMLFVNARLLRGLAEGNGSKQTEFAALAQKLFG